MADSTDAPTLPRFLADPRPVLWVGTASWFGATVGDWLIDPRWDFDLQTCVAGLGVGVFGALIFALQLRGARRGDKSAQVGLI